MAEYIEREALVQKLAELYLNADPWIDVKVLNMAKNTIENQPTADVEEVRHGYWKPFKYNIGQDEIINYTCSECGRRLIGYSNPKDAPYCYCGAKMDEE